MNIALISREYPPFFGGGIGSYTVRFARALAAAGHRPVVVTVSADGEEHREPPDDAGVTVVRLPCVAGDGKGGFDWSGPHAAIATPETRAAFHTFHPVSVFAMQVARAMPGLVREFAIEAIEAPDTGALAWFLLNARRTGAAWAQNLPPVTTLLHSPTAWIAECNGTRLDGPVEWQLSAMEMDQARWSDSVVSPSAALADWAAASWGIPRERIAVVPYAMGELERETERVAPALAVETPCPFQVLFVGRLEPRKGVDTLLEGFAHAVAEGLNAELTLVGEDMRDAATGRGSGAASLERWVPEAVRPRVTLRGKLPPAHLPALIGACDAVAVPSPMDNFPFTCVEAMARGKVVIAGAAGGMAEMIEHGRSGLLFAARNARACAAALTRVAAMNAAERERMGRAAAERIRSMCGNAAVITRRVECFRQVNPPARSVAVPAAVAVNAGTAAPAWLDRLGAALAHADFAHGWTSWEGRVRAFATPRIESLAVSSRAVGPVVLSERAAGDPRLAWLLRTDPRGGLACPSAWALLTLLCTLGYRGAVVPEVVTETPPDADEQASLHELTRRIEDLERSNRHWKWRADQNGEELGRIKSSRGWAMLQRIYSVLHILKGRGLSRAGDYHRPASTPTPGPSAGRNQIA